MATSRIYLNREEAGVQLGAALQKRRLPPPIVVLGLPRGGVPVAAEVARALHAPLDVLVVRKIGMPGQPEFAVGAIALGDILVRDPRIALGEAISRTVQSERAELARRERVYRHGQAPLDLKGQTVVLVDDGVATGCTMLAAVRAAVKAGAARTVVAAPVASEEAASLLEAEGAEAFFLQIPAGLSSIGEWYEHFEQLEDAQVQRVLEHARSRPVRQTG